MRGVGGPLLCIGDLLSDVGEAEDSGDHHHLAATAGGSAANETRPHSPTSTATSSSSLLKIQPSDLSKLFQEDYDHLKEALANTDHSWTALTLKLCTALGTANKLVQSANCHVGILSEKVGELEKIIKKGDAAIAEAKTVHSWLIQKDGSTSS